MSIDAYFLEQQSCQISSRSDLKRRSRRFFFPNGRPDKTKKLIQEEEQQEQDT